MYKIRKHNKIAEVGLQLLSDEKYTLTEEEKNPDAVVLRSYKLQEEEFGDELYAVARAGAGVNNIPVDKATEKGIVVFNTPGANANAVKELVLAGLFMSSRKISESISALKAVEDRSEIAKVAEKLKSQFAGPEVSGKTLGIIGLGAIGVHVAQAATSLGMKVVGYDPFISIKNALNMPKEVDVEKNLESVLAKADYITLHIPATSGTKQFINAERIGKMKDGVRLLNFSRSEIVNVVDIRKGIESEKIAYYVSDFADNELLDLNNCLTLPHLGASTYEAEDNCAIMACAQLKDYLETGAIRNSVNFPEVHVESPNGEGSRLCLIHKNVPKMISTISDIVSRNDTNIQDMTNKSKEDYAYTVIDTNHRPDDQTLNEIKGIEGMIRVRVI